MCVRAYVCVCACVRAYVCACARVHMYACVCMCGFGCVFVFVRVCVCMCVCMCLRAYIGACMRVHAWCVHGDGMVTGCNTGWSAGGTQGTFLDAVFWNNGR